jgi:hypothetical protein
MVYSGMAFAAAASVTAMIAAGMTFVGSAMSFIGQITGNEKLTKIGGIVSLAGGITTLANNMGLIGEAAGATTTTTAAEAASASSIMEGNTVQDALAGSNGSILSDTGKMLSSGSETLSGSGLLSDTGKMLSGTGSGTGIIANSNPFLGSITAGSGIGQSGAGLGFDLGSSLTNTGANLGSLAGAESGFSWSKVNNWLKENEETLSLGSEMLKGISSIYTSQMQADAYKEAVETRGKIDMALKQMDFDRADELMARYSDSIKKLQQREIFKPNADVYSGTSNGENVNRGILKRAWYPNSQKV